jgi:hypothetical protein
MLLVKLCLWGNISVCWANTGWGWPYIVFSWYQGVVPWNKAARAWSWSLKPSSDALMACSGTSVTSVLLFLIALGTRWISNSTYSNSVSGLSHVVVRQEMHSTNIMGGRVWVTLQRKKRQVAVTLLQIMTPTIKWGSWDVRWLSCLQYKRTAVSKNRRS